MDDFLSQYFLLATVAIIANIAFWGGIIYLIIRFLRSKSGLSRAQKLDLIAKGMQAYSGRGVGASDLMDSKAGQVAASHGIDLNDRR